MKNPKYSFKVCPVFHILLSLRKHGISHGPLGPHQDVWYSDVSQYGEAGQCPRASHPPGTVKECIIPGEESQKRRAKKASGIEAAHSTSATHSGQALWWWWCRHQAVSDSHDPMDWSLPGSSVHRILQARILGWLPISFSRGSSRPRDQTWISCIAVRIFTD